MNQVNDFSDAEIIAIKKRVRPLSKQWGETLAFARELEQEFKKKYGIGVEQEIQPDSNINPAM